MIDNDNADMKKIKLYAQNLLEIHQRSMSIHLLYSLNSNTISIGHMGKTGSFVTDLIIDLDNDIFKSFVDIFTLISLKSKKTTLMFRYQKKSNLLTLFGSNQCTLSSIIIQV